MKRHFSSSSLFALGSCYRWQLRVIELYWFLWGDKIWTISILWCRVCSKGSHICCKWSINFYTSSWKTLSLFKASVYNHCWRSTVNAMTFYLHKKYADRSGNSTDYSQRLHLLLPTSFQSTVSSFVNSFLSQGIIYPGPLLHLVLFWSHKEN